MKYFSKGAFLTDDLDRGLQGIYDSNKNLAAKVEPKYSNLIAAAPEMLEALELACEKLAHDQNFSRLELTVLLEKAIAKARGES